MIDIEKESFMTKELFSLVDKKVFANYSHDHVSALKLLSMVDYGATSILQIAQRAIESFKNGEIPNKLVFKVKLQQHDVKQSHDVSANQLIN